MRDLLLLLPMAACHAPAVLAPEGAVNEVSTWSIYDGDMLILSVRNEPGAITSTAPPPPGMQPLMHPFLSAAAQEAGHESQLKDLLDVSTSTDDFLARLKAAGFRVERE